MKLCPLFESITHQPQLELHVAPETQQRHFWRGVAAAQQALPREAIEAAIVTLEHAASQSYTDDDAKVHLHYAEQLRALLPKECGE